MIDQKFQNIDKIFSISSEEELQKMAIEVFNFQYLNNSVYKQYCDYLAIQPTKIRQISEIPFLPISFFKTHSVSCGDVLASGKEFTSSGTTGMVTSSHYVKDIKIYEQSFIKGFEHFYGKIDDYIVLGLLPSYLEREGSSLIYMVDKLIELSNHPQSGFFLDDYDALLKVIAEYKSSKKIILLGVSYALLDLVETYNPGLVFLYYYGDWRNEREA